MATSLGAKAALLQTLLQFKMLKKITQTCENGVRRLGGAAFKA